MYPLKTGFLLKQVDPSSHSHLHGAPELPNELYALDVRKTGREEEKQPQYSRPPSKWTLLQSPPSPVLVDRSSLGIRCMQEPLTSNSSLWGEQDFPMQVP